MGLKHAKGSGVTLIYLPATYVTCHCDPANGADSTGARAVGVTCSARALVAGK